MRLVGVLALVVALVACASAPPSGSVVTAVVWGVVSPTDWASGLRPAERDALRAAGVDASVVAVGRVVKVHCAMTTDGWWESLGVLPAGVAAQQGATLRLRMHDAGDNHRLGVNPVLGPSVPANLPAGQRAYRFVPDWRELGRSTNFERVELPMDLRDRYAVVQGSYLIKCRQPDAS